MAFTADLTPLTFEPKVSILDALSKGYEIRSKRMLQDAYEKEQAKQQALDALYQNGQRPTADQVYGVGGYQMGQEFEKNQAANAKLQQEQALQQQDMIMKNLGHYKEIMSDVYNKTRFEAQQNKIPEDPSNPQFMGIVQKNLSPYYGWLSATGHQVDPNKPPDWGAVTSLATMPDIEQQQHAQGLAYDKAAILPYEMQQEQAKAYTGFQNARQLHEANAAADAPRQMANEEYKIKLQTAANAEKERTQTLELDKRAKNKALQVWQAARPDKIRIVNDRLNNLDQAIAALDPKQIEGTGTDEKNQSKYTYGFETGGLLGSGNGIGIPASYHELTNTPQWRTLQLTAKGEELQKAATDMFRQGQISDSERRLLMLATGLDPAVLQTSQMHQRLLEAKQKLQLYKKQLETNTVPTEYMPQVGPENTSGRSTGVSTGGSNGFEFMGFE
jgi:hypothetical protein